MRIEPGTSESLDEHSTNVDTMAYIWVSIIVNMRYVNNHIVLTQLNEHFMSIISSFIQHLLMNENYVLL